MTHHQSWTLTDVQSDTWLDSFAIGSDTLRLPCTRPWSIRKRTLRGGLRDGVDLIEVNNGALSFAVLPTRGMGLWRGSYHGHFLGWQSPVAGPVHPKFVDAGAHGGTGWLTGFDEWLCRCGLGFNGPPGEDVSTDQLGRTTRNAVTLHGRIANLPAQFVEVRVERQSPHEITVRGQVDETGLFYPHLRLTTSYATVPGSHRLVIHDIVENRGAQPAEMELLYHLNIGPPFLEAGSRVIAPIHEMAPRDARAAEGMDTFDTYAGPVPGFAEQVYYYDLLADDHGGTLAMLYNAAGDRGLVVRMHRPGLPCFAVWKNTAAIEDGYVTGLEPATNYPNFKSFEREQGRVRVLGPGGRWETLWTIEIYDTASGVALVQAEIAKLQAQSPEIIHRAPQIRFSPASSVI